MPVSAEQQIHADATWESAPEVPHMLGSRTSPGSRTNRCDAGPGHAPDAHQIIRLSSARDADRSNRQVMKPS